MPKFTLIAAADFAATCGPLTAGEPIAEIHTDLELGELASLIRTRHLVHVEGDDDSSDSSGPVPAPPIESAPPAESVTPREDDEPTGTAAGPADSEPLAKLIDSKSAKLLAAEGVNDVGELRQWIAGGNRPEQLNGIGSVGEANILTATGLSLPQ